MPVMRIGYVARNGVLDCTPSSTFRLASYSAERMRRAIANNLDCLRQIFEFNVAHGVFYYRISSDTIPFASHEVCDFDWQSEFSAEFAALGRYIRAHDLRIAVHPGQYTLVNSPNEQTWQNSSAELDYHAALLDALELDLTAKIQLHVGGIYGDKAASIARFIERFPLLSERVQRRLAVENDERLYGVADCLAIARAVGIPIIFDDFHFRLLDDGIPHAEALAATGATWGSADGVPLLDYSSQQPDKRFGSHSATLDEADFNAFLDRLDGRNVDVMLEIKDKDRSALRALAILKARGLA